MNALLMSRDERSITSLASNHARRYRLPVAANSATGFCSPNIVRRISATVSKAGAFFMSAISFYGGCAWGAFERAGFLTSRSANLRTAATQFCFAAGSGGSSTLGAVPMKHALNTSGISVEHQKAYCLHLLKTLLRYSNPSELICITTTIEAEVTKNLANRFNPGLNDARYDVYRRFWLKGGEA